MSYERKQKMKKWKNEKLTVGDEGGGGEDKEATKNKKQLTHSITRYRREERHFGSVAVRSHDMAVCSLLWTLPMGNHTPPPPMCQSVQHERIAHIRHALYIPSLLPLPHASYSLDEKAFGFALAAIQIPGSIDIAEDGAARKLRGIANRNDERRNGKRRTSNDSSNALLEFLNGFLNDLSSGFLNDLSHGF